MNIFKSHFWYHKSQRNGILLLVVIVLILQASIFFNVFSSKETVNIKQPAVLSFQQEIDSLKNIEIENRKPKIYPFNPNYITDYKGEKLGMSLLEIDRLLVFRKTNTFINSKEEFQKVTKVSDSLLMKISPFFKFPDWVVKRTKKLQQQKLKEKMVKASLLKENKGIFPPEKVRTTSINKATVADFQSVVGVEVKLAERIVSYRKKLQGFSFNSQLFEVWGLHTKLANTVLKHFKVAQKPQIVKRNVNTVTFKELLKNPYIDYKLCVKIFNYRDEVAELQSIAELKNIHGFPLDKYDRIVLYLLAQ